VQTPVEGKSNFMNAIIVIGLMCLLIFLSLPEMREIVAALSYDHGMAARQTALGAGSSTEALTETTLA
jgi:hypothetical protein